MFQKIDNTILTLTSDPSFFKKKCASRLVGITSTALVALSTAICVLVTPFFLGLTALLIGLGILMCSPKKMWEPIQQLTGWMKCVVVSMACLGLNPFVALFSPKTLVAMHTKVDQIFDTTFPNKKSSLRHQQPNHILDTKPLLFISRLSIEEGLNQINAQLEKQKAYHPSSSSNQPLLIYGPKKNGKKTYALKLGESLGYPSENALTLNMKHYRSKGILASHLLRYLNKAQDTLEKLQEAKSEKNFKKIIDSNSLFQKKSSDFINTLGIIYIKNYTSNTKINRLLEIAKKTGFLLIYDSTCKMHDPQFKIQVEFSLPTEDERYELIAVHLEKCSKKDPNLDMRSLAINTEGMPRKQVVEFIEKGIHDAYLNDEPLSNTHFSRNPKLLTADVDNIIYAENKELTKIFDKHLTVLKNWDQAQARGTKMPAGILLHGKPGCGKTYGAKSLRVYAEKNGVPMAFQTIDPIHIGSKYMHEGVEKITRVFKEAEKLAPAILFIDECEGILGKRSSGESGSPASESNRNQELGTLLKLIENARNHKIVVIAATNLFEHLDEAFKNRRGRFDDIIEIKSPNTEMRKSLFEAELSIKPCCDTLDMDEFAKLTEDMNASDIHCIVNMADIASMETDHPISNKMIKQEIKNLRSKLNSSSENLSYII